MIRRWTKSGLSCLPFILAACATDPDSVSGGAGGGSNSISSNQGGNEQTAGFGGRDNSIDGSGGSAGVGGSSAPQGSATGGSGHADGSGVGGGSQGGSGNQSGSGGTSVSDGAAGSEQGQGGTENTSAGGSGQGGTEQGQGSTGSVDPTPECDWANARCTGQTFELCESGEITASVECSTPQLGFNCSPELGCYGECLNDDVRCSGDAVETCQDGSWSQTTVCPFQCVNGACEGACEPGEATCSGSSVLLCGDDFQYDPPEECPGDLNATATCSDGDCGLACAGTFADCDSNGSCEVDLSSPLTCGACNAAPCPTPVNATATCDGGSCGFECTPGFEDCDGNASNGCEVDVTSDALNCGACGNSCYGGACGAGQCDYDFEVVAEVSTRARAVTVHGDSVYWYEGAQIKRRAKDGSGDVWIIATGQNLALPLEILVDQAFVYWLNNNQNNQGGIYKAPAAGALSIGDVPAASKLTTLTLTYGDLALANGTLYWNDSNTATALGLASAPLTVHVYSMSIAGGAPTVAMTLTNFKHDSRLEIRGNELFATRYTEDIFGWSSGVVSYNVSNGASFKGYVAFTRVAPNQMAFSTSNSHLVHLTRLQGAATCISATPLTVGDPLPTPACLTSRFDQGSSLAVDETSIYHVKNGGLRRIPLVGGTPETLDGQGNFVGGEFETLSPESQNAQAISFDDDGYVYWSVDTASGERAILRAPK